MQLAPPKLLEIGSVPRKAILERVVRNLGAALVVSLLVAPRNFDRGIEVLLAGASRV